MKRGYADTLHGQVHYVMAGSGPPLLLLGSAGRSSRMFVDLMSLLADRYHVIAVDMLGAGNSDPIPQGATVPILADSIVRVLDDIGLPSACIFGLHTGNKIGSAMAARWPQRVDRFVLCGQTHSIIPSREVRNKGIGDKVRSKADLDDDHAWAVAWAMSNQRVSTLWWHERYLRERDMRSAVQYAKWAVLDEIQSFEAIPLLYEINFAYDMEADWAKIQVPTLVVEVVTPREDALYGRQGPQVQDRIPGSRLAMLEARGYKLSLEDRASDLAALIEAFCS